MVQNRVKAKFRSTTLTVAGILSYQKALIFNWSES